MVKEHVDLPVDMKLISYPQDRISMQVSRFESAASISVGIVIPSTWFVYLYKQTVSITVVVMGTKQFSDKTTHRQLVKTGFAQKWENRCPRLLQDYSRILPFFKDSISSQFCITQRFKELFFQSEAAK